MPRQARIDIAGLLYHVTGRGIERREIYKDDEDRKDFLIRLGATLQWGKAECYAWSLMPNHFHLLIRTGEKPLSRMMRKLLTGYAVNFNVRYKRNGHLFQNRYKSIICEEEDYFMELVRYIHLNPLRAGIVSGMEGLNKYPWTGHAVLIGAQGKEWQNQAEVLGRFGKKRREAARKYCGFVEAGILQGRRQDLAGGGLIRSAGGLLEVLKNRRDKIMVLGDDRILGEGSFVEAVLNKLEQEEKLIKANRKTVKFEEIIKDVCGYFKIEPAQINGRSRKTDAVEARAVMIYVGIVYLGINGNRLGRELGINPSTVSRLYARGEIIFKGNKLLRESLLSFV